MEGINVGKSGSHVQQSGKILQIGVTDFWGGFAFLSLLKYTVLPLYIVLPLRLHPYRGVKRYTLVVTNTNGIEFKYSAVADCEKIS